MRSSGTGFLRRRPCAGSTPPPALISSPERGQARGPLAARLGRLVGPLGAPHGAPALRQFGSHQANRPKGDSRTGPPSQTASKTGRPLLASLRGAEGDAADVRSAGGDPRVATDHAEGQQAGSSDGGHGAAGLEVCGSNGAVGLGNGAKAAGERAKEMPAIGAPAAAPSPGSAHWRDEDAGWMEEDGDVWLPHRWKVTALMGIAFVLCNMDKVNMSVAVIPMAGELGWSATSRGIVQSAFFWGYTLTQIPAGWISTRVGGALVLLCGVALWSLGTLVAPGAAHLGFFWLCASRILVGLGEGFAPSAATSVLAKQVPVTERSRAVSTVFGGLDLGSAIGLLMCGPLIRMFGWPCVFYLFAVFGLVWCLVWPLAKPEKRDRAMREKALREAERLAASAEQGKDDLKVPWGQFLRSAPVWAVTTAHFCFNWGYYTLLSWLPSYFELALNLNIQNSSFLTVIPYLSMTAMTPLVGPMADALVEQGWSVTHVRKLSQGIAFLGPALCMLACSVLTSNGGTGGLSTFGVSALVALFSVAFAFGAWSRAGLYCNHQDLSSRYASALLGISNTAGAIPGILGVWSTGYLLDLTGSWQLALFYPIAACQLIGLLVYTLFGSSKKQAWS
eukprot:evm.model.scf_130EXC.2 EVM.evm.TU.scf_130EXC.2   scf_130EXC:62628-66747(-)